MTSRCISATRAWRNLRRRKSWRKVCENYIRGQKSWKCLDNSKRYKMRDWKQVIKYSKSVRVEQTTWHSGPSAICDQWRHLVTSSHTNTQSHIYYIWHQIYCIYDTVYTVYYMTLYILYIIIYLTYSFSNIFSACLREAVGSGGQKTKNISWFLQIIFRQVFGIQ